MKTRTRTHLIILLWTLLLVACKSSETGLQSVKAGGADPSVVSITPASGTGNAQLFTAVFSSASSLSDVRILINADKDGRNGCYVYYVPADRQFLLVADSGDQSVPLKGGESTVENSQCAVRPSGSSASLDGKKLTVKVDLRFKPAFAGPKVVYGLAQDSNGASTGLVSVGAWKVTK